MTDHPVDAAPRDRDRASRRRQGLAAASRSVAGRGSRTRFTWTERLRFPWWMGGPVGALAAKPILRAVWRRNLATLKQLVEAQAATAAG